VVGVFELLAELERGRARDQCDIDLVAVERGEPGVELVRPQVDFRVAARQLEHRAAQPRPLATRLERSDERGRPEVLVQVVARHEASICDDVARRLLDT
jgi:hypothetical protein